MNIIKRNGNKEKCDLSKIRNAVLKAFSSVDKSVSNDELDDIIDEVYLEDGITVEQIQDSVINALRLLNYNDVADSYVSYRNERAAIRRANINYNNKLREKLLATNVVNQNANVDEKSFGGRKGEAESFVAKQFALTHCMSKMARKNHENNEIYIHDLDSYSIGMHNCLSIPLDPLLAYGFITRQSNIRPAGSISTAFQLVAVIFQLQSLQQFGGVSYTHLDWTMVPYIRKSFFKHFVTKYIFKCLEEENIDAEKLTAKEFKEYKDNKKKEFKQKYHIGDEYFTLGSFKVKVVKFHIDDKKIEDINKAWYKEARLETLEELNQAVEGLYHNLNTLQSRSGNQLPFTSINYGTCTLPEGRMVIKALLLGSIKGVGDKLSPNSDKEFGRTYATPIFPCGIFQYMKGVNDKPGTPNYDMYQLALKSTARRLYPNYVNVDWSVNKGYDRSDPRTYTSTMGCRTYNGYDINGFGQLKDGRGNICPVTIILPTLAMEANRDVESFIKLLDTKIHEAKDMLIERFDWICKQSPDSAKFMWENNTMFGYKPEEGIRSAMKHGTLAIGQLGLAECLQLLIGTDQTTEKGMQLAKRIESLYSQRCKEFKEKYKLNFGVYLTPAENLAYTALKKFRKKYGEIPNVSDKEFFTNSMHVPVWKKITPFEKIDIESQLTGYSNAGCITYVELDSSVINNIEGLETIVNYAMNKNIPYFAINIPADRCKDCGYQGEISDKCPNCGSTNINRLRRVTGYLTGNYTTAFNKGKQDEVEYRVKHIKIIE